jgi:hypothetical protein
MTFGIVFSYFTYHLLNCFTWYLFDYALKTLLDGSLYVPDFQRYLFDYVVILFNVPSHCSFFLGFALYCKLHVHFFRSTKYGRSTCPFLWSTISNDTLLFLPTIALLDMLKHALALDFRLGQLTSFVIFLSCFKRPHISCSMCM